MQRRNSVRSHGLSRQKSTSSANSVHLAHIHPDTAEHDAQNAAIQAFTRARERALNSTAQWPPPRSTERPVVRRHRSALGASRDGYTLHRQQSVRFVKPKSSEPGLRDDAVEYTPSRKPISRARASRHSSQTQAQKNASTEGMVFAAKGTAGDYINALISGEDYYTPEDDIASLPSSYRRLRKSKSMYAGPVINEVSGLKHEQKPSERELQSLKAGYRKSNVGINRNVGGRRLGAPRSMSFLQTRRETSATLISRGPAPKNKLLDGNTPRPDHMLIQKHKSSVFLRPKPARPDKLFRKTLRDASTGTNSLGAKASKDGRLRLKARKVSQNFKQKLKTFFNMSKENDEGLELPPQQVKSRKTHVIEKDGSIYGLDDYFLTAEDTESTTVSRVTSGIPALHAVPSELQLRSRRGSLNSLRSARKVSDEKSRVTSWSDSDTKTYSTLNSSRCEWDKEQLSAIKENRSRIISHAQERDLIRLHCSASVEKTEQPGSDELMPAKKVNGQRIYSALMKKLDANKQGTRSDQDTRKEIVEDFMVQEKVPTRDSSKGFIAVGKTRPATVRHIAAHNITETGLLNATSMATIMHSAEPRIASRLNENNAFGSNGLREMSTSPSNKTLRSGGTECIGSQDVATSLSRSLMSPELERLAPSGRTLSERSSAFFGSPSRNLFRTQSPYRRAIRDSMRTAAEGTPAKSPEFNPWKKSLKSIRFRCPSTCESEEDRKMTYEESIYSSDGAELFDGLSCNDRLVEKLPRPPEKHGDATIFLDPPKYETPAVKPTRRLVSSASSTEWKTWLSANLSALDQSCSPPEQSHTGEEKGADTLRFPRMSGHVRESAQIVGEQDSLKVTRGFQRYNGSSLGIDQGLATASPMLQQNNLRSALSLANLESSKENVSMSKKQALLKPLFHARSLDALGTQDQNVATPKIKLARKKSSSKLHALPLSTPMIRIEDQRQTAAKFSRRGGSKAGHSDADNMKSENVIPRAADKYDSHALRVSSLHTPESSSNRLSTASKHMVELFLDSRRRCIAGTDDTDAFL